MKLLPTIVCEEKFKRDYLPYNNEKCFFISILDPDHKEPLRKDTDNYKTFWIWDIDHSVGDYKAFTYEQAEEMYKFIKNNEGKHLVVHCGIGVSRSPAVAEFYYEMQGGAYKILKEKYKNILPNSRILTYLRMVESNEVRDLKLNFI